MHGAVVIIHSETKEDESLMDGLGELGMVDEDEKGILRCRESFGGRKKVFKFLTSTGIGKRM